MVSNSFTVGKGLTVLILILSHTKQNKTKQPKKCVRACVCVSVCVHTDSGFFHTHMCVKSLNKEVCSINEHAERTFSYQRQSYCLYLKGLS